MKGITKSNNGRHFYPLTYDVREKTGGFVESEFRNYFLIYRQINAFNGRCNTGLFVSPSGTSELDCATTKIDTAERSISIGRESLKVFFCTRGLGVLAGSTARG